MHRFNDDVAKIEEATKTFINESFKKLRSAEGLLPPAPLPPAPALPALS